MNPVAARLATFVFWSLIAATVSALAWRWFGNTLPDFVPGVLAALGVAYGVFIIAMNERAERRETSAASSKEVA